MPWTINQNPLMISHLVDRGIFRLSPWSVVDGGARGGIPQHWRFFKDQIESIGFEPEPNECDLLNKGFKGRGLRCRYFPVALHRDKGKREFFIPPHLPSSGFYNNKDLLAGTVSESDHDPRQSIVLETVDFDSFAHEQTIRYVDFMKLDVEGAELDILHGCRQLLDRKQPLGIELEVRFHRRPSHCPCFSDVDAFLRREGFSLFALDTRSYARSALPKPSVQDLRLPNNQPGGEPAHCETTTGQVLVGDAVYFRDFVRDRSQLCDAPDSDPALQILKLACLYELYGLSDCAAQLLLEFREILESRIEVDHLLDLLTPNLLGRTWHYGAYLAKARDLFDNKRGRLVGSDDRVCLAPTTYKIAQGVGNDLYRNNVLAKPSLVTYLRILTKLALGYYTKK